MVEETKAQVTFVLTGPRKGFTGVLGGRYGFKDGKLNVNVDVKDKMALVLCSRYACNIEGENPLWKEVDGGSVKISEMSKPSPVVSTVTGEPQASIVLPPVVADDADADADDADSGDNGDDK